MGKFSSVNTGNSLLLPLPSTASEDLALRVFKKRSPIATDISKAILNLNEGGILKAMEEIKFAYSTEVWHSLAGPSSIASGLMKNYWLQQEKYRSNTSPRNNSAWNKAVRLARFIYQGQEINLARAATLPRSPDVVGRSSSRWKYSSPDTAENHEEASAVLKTKEGEKRLRLRSRLLPTIECYLAVTSKALAWVLSHLFEAVSTSQEKEACAGISTKSKIRPKNFRPELLQFRLLNSLKALRVQTV
ncbi:hypothetical protein QQP08_020406 [Theobroma cacao]|nr:hypothetical protein QQP08_020406 [Theobroma cacao]